MTRLSVSMSDIKLPGNEIKYPGEDETNDHELKKGLYTVEYSLARGAGGESPKGRGNYRREESQVNEMDHFFLPTLISTASNIAR